MYHGINVFPPYIRHADFTMIIIGAEQWFSLVNWSDSIWKSGNHRTGQVPDSELLQIIKQYTDLRPTGQILNMAHVRYFCSIIW